MMNANTYILAQLPYRQPFLFVDEITSVSENEITGNYRLPEDAYFYQGHFKDFPMTPGVIHTEIMAQIGVVCLGIYINHNALYNNKICVLTSTEINFLKPSFPGDKLTVKSKKVYFRFEKLKCDVSLFNESGDVLARGSISGMLTDFNPNE